MPTGRNHQLYGICMNRNDTNRVNVLGKMAQSAISEIISISENGDSTNTFYAIDLETKEAFDTENDFKKLEERCQKSNRNSIAICNLKSVLKK